MEFSKKIQELRNKNKLTQEKEDFLYVILFYFQP